MSDDVSITAECGFRISLVLIKFIFNAFVEVKAIEKFDNWSDICVFRSLYNSTSKRVLDLLKPAELTVWKVVIKGGGALCAGNAVALLVFGPVMP